MVGAGEGRAAVTAESEAVFLRVDFDGLHRSLSDRAPDEPPRPAPSRSDTRPGERPA